MSHAKSGEARAARTRVAVLVFAALIATPGCAPKKETMRSSVSRDGKHTAVLIERGDDGFFRSLLLCNGRGVCSKNKKTLLTGIHGSSLSEIIWTSNTQLTVVFNPLKTGIYSKREKKNGITIYYVTPGE